ncbi:MAG: hypothetical protein CVU44_11610 [Chloroflexi bacterium HGW-Chloroflexi-6]|nr:MAG: hypothetical protein CVU44_11610 [Chloroflexi bacterium HGW-Chloroflexi-6]
MSLAADPRHFVRRMRQIKAQVPNILSQWGLLPKFKRWRLAQDPDTGTVVLFGILDNKHIATHTTTPFSDYFDPRLLHDLATELHVQVIPSANDGLRYAFILERGELDIQPPVNTRPTDDDGKQIERRIAPQPNVFVSVGKHIVEHQKLDKFLKIAEAIEAAKIAAAQPAPEVLAMNEMELNQLMAEYENERNKSPSPGSVG